MQPAWTGVYPAITTPFLEDGSVDFDLLVRHATWLTDNGCHGLIGCGSLGEGATLSLEEKGEVCRALAVALGSRVPIIAGVAALSTADAVRQAEQAAEAGCVGLMVLPSYCYSTDWREAKAHVEAVMRATPLSCMLYNNPISYGTDFRPEHIAELAAEIPNFHSVKESSADVRRIAAIRALIGDRLKLMCGVDDVIVEGLRAGADGWVAGLVNAFPAESVAIYDWTQAGRHADVDALYRWFLPLLRLDVVPKLVQLIKLAQVHVGMGSATCRPPRLPLVGAELAEAEATIADGLRTRPTL